MKRITKATHRAFIRALASECEAVGIQAFPSKWNCGKPAYEVLTKAGLYTFSPCETFQDVTVFGRFEHAKEASRRVDCNPHSGKWNFHAGYCTTQEAIEYATEIVTRIITV